MSKKKENDVILIICRKRRKRVKSLPLKVHLVFRIIREGIGPKILSIMARCSLLSWVWERKPELSIRLGRGC